MLRVGEMPTLRTWVSRGSLVYCLTVPDLASGGTTPVFIRFFSLLWYFMHSVRGEASPLLCAIFSLVLTFLLWFSGGIILGKTDSSDVV